MNKMYLIWKFFVRIHLERFFLEIEPTDHPLGPGRQFVVWAKGQTQVRWQDIYYLYHIFYKISHSQGNLKLFSFAYAIEMFRDLTPTMHPPL